MKIWIYLKYFFRSVWLRGFFRTIDFLIKEVWYERRFGIKTSMIKPSESTEFYHYQGASYKVLLWIFSRLDERLKNFSFVDIGCGKGRVLIVAEYSGYNDITGIELDNELLEEAQQNIEHYVGKRPGSKIRLVHANALEYSFENKPTVYFLFNPFNEEVLDRVLARIAAASASETWFVYMNPLYASVFYKNGLELVTEHKAGRYTEVLIFKRKDN